MTKYSPTDTWPEPQKSWFKDVYKSARGHGWSISTHTNHGGSATLTCPTGQCDLKIFATGRAAENVAKSHLKAIEHCRHGHAVDPVVRARELLDKAERLLDALDAMYESNVHRNQADALFDDPEGFDESEIEELWLSADKLSGEAEELLADLSGADQPTVVEVTSQALLEARDLLGPLPKGQDVLDQKVRLRSLRNRCDVYRKLISQT